MEKEVTENERRASAHTDAKRSRAREPLSYNFFETLNVGSIKHPQEAVRVAQEEPSLPSQKPQTTQEA